MSLGLLLLRLVVGGVLIGHGLRKLNARLGAGPHHTGLYFESLGYRPGRRFAVLAGASEVAAGLSLLLGGLTPLGAAIGIGVMLSAIRHELVRGFWAENRGCEFPFVLAATLLALAATGPGRWSLDHALDLDLTGEVWAGGALVLAVVAAAPMWLLVGRAKRQSRPSRKEVR